MKCTTLGCNGRGDVAGIYDDGDIKHRVRYCYDCSADLAEDGCFVPDGNPLAALLGSPDRPPVCRVLSDDIAVHWWRNDDSGLCLCGKTTQAQDEIAAKETA